MSSTLPVTEVTRTRIDRLFLCFTAFYGQLWRSQFKNEEFLEFMKNEWGKALNEFEERHMETAISRCRKDHNYPPTLPQFVDLCQTAKKREVCSQPKMEVQNKVTPEVALHHLAQMKVMLHIKTK